MAFAKYDCKCTNCNAVLLKGDAIKFVEITKSSRNGICANTRQVKTGKYRVTCVMCNWQERIGKLNKKINDTIECITYFSSTGIDADQQLVDEYKDHLVELQSEIDYVLAVVSGKLLTE